MKSIAVKFLAIFLAALFLTGAVCCGVSLVFLLEHGLYEKTLEDIRMERLEAMSYRVAYNYAQEYASKEFGNLGEDEFFLLRKMAVSDSVQSSVIHVAVVDDPTRDPEAEPGEDLIMTHTLTPEYAWILPAGVQPPKQGWVDMDLYVIEDEAFMVYYCQDVSVDVAVQMRVTTELVPEYVSALYSLRYYLPLILIGCLLLFAVCMVYLCWAAGKKKGNGIICPGGLNRLPLDLYIAAVAFTGFCGGYGVLRAVDWAWSRGWNWVSWALAAAGCYGICLLVVGLIFALAAQGKVKGFWWRHSVIGWCCIRVVRGLRWIWRGICATVRLLPVTWQWLLTAVGMGLSIVICLIGASSYYYPYNRFFAMALTLVLMACAGIVLYGGYAFGTILKGAREMARGNLDHKINTKYLVSSFRDCGERLNALSHAAMEAARRQMKSERMKTELITNVSHDIKTPLTSIINYVDLLQKPHGQEEGEQYLEVLSRQSLRLKKLVDDLMEMSKASTGNLSVEPVTLDAAETVLQALGEFGDKLEAVPLSVVFRQPPEPIFILADGKRTWRVMSNLLGNAVKYALPGTRLYVDICAVGREVMISMKNISKEPLNIDAEELMERFVRGDVSRNTEGSGLGLNIARSLMELQGGRLELLVDGDLFKVTLFFPKETEAA